MQNGEDVLPNTCTRISWYTGSFHKSQNLAKHLLYGCYKCNPFLSKSDQGTNNLISEISICHQFFVSWSSCIFCAAIKNNSNLIGFGWMTQCMVRQIPYFSINWCIFGNPSIPFTKNFFHKFLVVTKMFWILLKSLLQVLGFFLYHLLIICQLRNRFPQWQRSLILITHFYCLIIHELQIFLVLILDVV